MSSSSTMPLEQWWDFLKTNTIIPIGLITINQLNGWRESADVKPILRDPLLKSRSEMTRRQSDNGERESMYGRVSIGGIPIHDNGVQVIEGAMRIGELARILGEMAGATFVQVSEGSGHSKQKVELRRSANTEDSAGQLDIEMVRKSLMSVNPDTAVCFHLWCNPNQHNGWFQFNLVINWDTNKAAGRELTELGLMLVKDIPTLDLERHGISIA